MADTAEHVLFECERWSGLRTHMYGEMESFDKYSMVPVMLESCEKWDRISRFIQKVLRSKEDEDKNIV